MKKIILIAVLVIISKLSFSQGSSITIFTENGEKFWLISDGEKQNTNPQAKVVMNNLNNPSYKLKVIFQDSKIKSLDQSVQTEGVDPGPMDVVYTIKKNTKGKYVFRVTSFKPANGTPKTEDIVSVPDPKPAMEPKPEVNPRPLETRPTTTTTTTQTTLQSPQVTITTTIPGMDLTTNFPVIQMTTTEQQMVTTTTTPNQTIAQPVTQQNTEPERPAATNTSSACRTAASATLFSSFKTSIEKQSFEDTKLKMVNQFLTGNCVSTGQVKTLMSLFSFEANKLDIAKKAYKKTVDKESYFTLNDEFSFSSSADELTEFVSGD